MALSKKGIAASSPSIARVRCPMSKASSASSDLVVACSMGASYFSIEASDSPSSRLISVVASPTAASTPSLSGTSDWLIARSFRIGSRSPRE